MRGRNYVIPDDVKHLAVPVLAHRITLTADARLQGRFHGSIMDEMIAQTPVPVEEVWTENATA
jgi:MoxR-like ATPase